MRAADLFWQGRVERFRELVANGGPKVLIAPIWEAMNDGKVKDGGCREGLAYRSSVVEPARPFSSLLRAWEMNEEITVVVEEATDRALTAMERLNDTVKKFRSETKNDLSSMKAVSDRVQAEVETMSQRYQRAVAILTSADFVQAVQNAERLVVALTAIQNLKPSRLAVSVFEADIVAPHDDESPSAPT